MPLSGFNGEQGQAGNVVFPAGEARQRMHIRAARLTWRPVFGKNGATTKAYGVRTRFRISVRRGVADNDACRGERDRAVGGI
ncbi:hypothetical protein EFR84_21530 [Rhizobium chutanense]|uniref:Uncharacterized protein n=1 Tax=Rhizobium chutanense TaxID=2035448 RepID=A0A3S0XMZ9_9HYPH|nr:hypothetical protein EFR84_21530 [Rhizobium chutanense]